MTLEYPREPMPPRHTPPPLGWVWEGLRGAVFLRPRWRDVAVGPWGVACAMFCMLGLAVLLQWALMRGAGQFHWPALTGGWLNAVTALWVCWLVARHAARQADAAAEPGPREQAARPVRPGAGALFGVALVQSLALQAPLGALLVACVRWGESLVPGWGPWLSWGSSVMLLVLPWLSVVWMLCRHTPAWPVRAVVLAVLAGSTAVSLAAPAPLYWYPDEDTREASADAADDDDSPRFVLNQDVLEAQSGALVGALDAIAPQRPGVVDLYAITFAPVADEDVFSREAGMVSDVMRDRFDAAGRSLRLQNHARTASDLPWATPLNLQRAIARMAERMDRDEDVLFIHLTSHGAQNGQLAASFWPLEVAQLTPAQLKTWLDEAGVRHRVISVSACYSGSWVSPLADDNTLVMTAADASHTSYGCGRKSELTFFGRAMYDEQLRRHTRSFEAAHAAARPIIDQREKAAGKTDGYSNPQIQVGAQIRPVLQALMQRLGE